MFYEQEKLGLSAYYDKRWVLDDNIHTEPIEYHANYEDEKEEEEEQEKEAFVAGGDAKNLKELCLQLENLFALDE